MLGSRPELKEELPGLLSIYEISVRKDGKALEIKDNPMTVKIPVSYTHLDVYKRQALIRNAYNERSSELKCPGDLFFYLFFLEFVRILSGNTDALIKSCLLDTSLEAIIPPNDYRDLDPNAVHKYMLTKRLGAELDYIVKGIDRCV